MRLRVYVRLVCCVCVYARVHVFQCVCAHARTCVCVSARLCAYVSVGVRVRVYGCVSECLCCVYTCHIRVNEMVHRAARHLQPSSQRERVCVYRAYLCALIMMCLYVCVCMTGRTALHLLARHAEPSSESVRLLSSRFAAATADNDGLLPLHHILIHSGVCIYIYNACYIYFDKI